MFVSILKNCAVYLHSLFKNSLFRACVKDAADFTFLVLTYFGQYFRSKKI